MKIRKAGSKESRKKGFQYREPSISLRAAQIVNVPGEGRADGPNPDLVS
jgi:hypothetical protein